MSKRKVADGGVHMFLFRLAVQLRVCRAIAVWCRRRTKVVVGVCQGTRSLPGWVMHFCLFAENDRAFSLMFLASFLAPLPPSPTPVSTRSLGSPSILAIFVTPAIHRGNGGGDSERGGGWSVSAAF